MADKDTNAPCADTKNNPNRNRNDCMKNYGESACSENKRSSNWRVITQWEKNAYEDISTIWNFTKNCTTRGRSSLVWMRLFGEERPAYSSQEIRCEKKIFFGKREKLKPLTCIGYLVKGVVIDGKRGVREVFRDIPIQYCQFHQIKTITRHLTRKPQTMAGQDLRAIALTLARTDEKTFMERLNKRNAYWGEFLSERTPRSCCKPNKRPYTHRKLRAACRSLKTNLPFLFTYQKFPELHIPNTTNTLDGSFSHLKNQVGIHRGKTSARRYKIIQEILMKKEDEK